jgi:predicted unusual protein kinase regulating ubiquinone biosynthesis (AarF/ABC1/UbiB family)
MAFNIPDAQDPHPGNLLATPDGRLAYLDFGMMSEAPRLVTSCGSLITLVLHFVHTLFVASLAYVLSRCKGIQNKFPLK